DPEDPAELYRRAGGANRSDTDQIDAAQIYQRDGADDRIGVFVSKRGFVLIAIIALVSCAGEAELYQRVQFGGGQDCPFPCTASPTRTPTPQQTPKSLGSYPRISALRVC